MKDWIKQRIQNLSDQLQEPECNNPTRVLAKKEAFEEILYMVENKALDLAGVVGQSEQLKCHHQYMNAGTLQGEAMKKCLKCGDYVKAL